MNNSFKDNKAEKVWSILELDWFSKNSYNIAMKYVSSWTPNDILRMLLCCIAFIGRYPDDVSVQVSEDLSLRKMFCEFSAATCLAALARGQDDKQLSLQSYSNLRKHVDNYDQLLQEKLPKLLPATGPAVDLLRKLAILISFDFEAVCHLKAWDQIEKVLLRAEDCKNSRLYELMADCILSIGEIPADCLSLHSMFRSILTRVIVLVSTLKKIVNQAWVLESFDSVKLAKYMRCLFQVALSENRYIAETLLDEINRLAEQASGVSC